MLNHAALYAAHQRVRWMRADAARFLRRDAATDVRAMADASNILPALADQRVALEGLRCNLNQIKSDLAWRRLRDAIDQKYSPSQPRVPAGSGRESGRWTSGGDGGSFGPASGDAGDGGMLDAGTGETLDESAIDGSDGVSGFHGEAGHDDAFGSGYDITWNQRTGSLNDPTRDDKRPTPITDRRVVSDADPDPVRPGEQYAQLDKIRDAAGQPYYEPGGHHEMARGVYEKWNLQPETWKIFKGSTTGTLPRDVTVRFHPHGIPYANRWGGVGNPHANYNDGVAELSENFLQRNNLKPEDMTPEQALELLAEIRESQDPRIRDFNRAMKMLRRVFRFRMGRGE